MPGKLSCKQEDRALAPLVLGVILGMEQSCPAEDVALSWKGVSTPQKHTFKSFLYKPGGFELIYQTKRLTGFYYYTVLPRFVINS